MLIHIVQGERDRRVVIVNELTAETNGGTLAVMGMTTPSATGVTVNGSNAALYGDSTLPETSYTAIASATGSSATTAVTVNLARNTGFQYDLNGTLTNDSLRNFAYDDENQLIQVIVFSMRVFGKWLESGAVTASDIETADEFIIEGAELGGGILVVGSGVGGFATGAELMAYWHCRHKDP